MYSLTHIVPLPLNKTKFLIVPNHIVYDRNNEILCLEEKCPKIHRTYICEGARTHITLVNVHCLKGILHNQTTTCDVKGVGQQEIIKGIEPRHIIILNTINTNVTSSFRKPFSINGYINFQQLHGQDQQPDLRRHSDGIRLRNETLRKVICADKN